MPGALTHSWANGNETSEGSTDILNESGSEIPAGTVLVIAAGWDNTTATAPTSTISSVGGATPNARIDDASQGASATAGSGVFFNIWTVRTVSAIAAGATVATITYSANATGKRWAVLGFSGMTDALRGTTGSAASAGGTPAPATSGTALVANDLVVGAVVGESNATPTGDADTTNGSWSTLVGGANSGGAAATNVALGMQYKFVTATGVQTYNATTQNDSRAGIISLVPAAVTTIGLGLPTDSGTAQSMTRRKVLTLGLATEADVSLTLERPVTTVPIGLATEADAALASIRIKRKTINPDPVVPDYWNTFEAASDTSLNGLAWNTANSTTGQSGDALTVGNEGFSALATEFSTTVSHRGLYSVKTTVSTSGNNNSWSRPGALDGVDTQYFRGYVRRTLAVRAWVMRLHQSVVALRWEESGSGNVFKLVGGSGETLVAGSVAYGAGAWVRIEVQREYTGSATNFAVKLFGGTNLEGDVPDEVLVYSLASATEASAAIQFGASSEAVANDIYWDSVAWGNDGWLGPYVAPDWDDSEVWLDNEPWEYTDRALPMARIVKLGLAPWQEDTLPVGGTYWTEDFVSASGPGVILSSPYWETTGAIEYASDGTVISNGVLSTYTWKTQPGADQFSRAVVKNTTSSAQGVAVRLQGLAIGVGSVSGYVLRRNGGTLDIVRVDSGGAGTVISDQGSVAVTASATDELLLVAIGSKLYGYLNGALTVTATDATYSTGYVGIRIRRDAAPGMDDWAGGNVRVLPLARQKVRVLGLATETDTSLGVTEPAGGNTVPIGLATEADSGQALGRQKIATLGLAIETDAPLALTARKVVTLGVATESDETFTLTRQKVVTLGLATESDSALALTKVDPILVTLGLASESDTPQALTRVKAKTLRPGPTTLFTEPFTGTDGATPAAWTTSAVGTGTAPTIQGNKLRLTTAASGDTSRARTSIEHLGSGLDRPVEVTYLMTPVTSGGSLYVWLKAASTYAFVAQPTTGWGFQINQSAGQYFLRGMTAAGGSSIISDGGVFGTLTVGQAYRVRFQVIPRGTDGAYLRVKVWADGGSEPGAWTATSFFPAGGSELDLTNAHTHFVLSHSGSGTRTWDIDDAVLTEVTDLEVDLAPYDPTKSTQYNLGRQKIRTLGLATETDTSLGVTEPGSTVVPIGQAAESDASQAISRQKVRALGQVSETDQGVTVTRAKVVTLGLATETGAPLAPTRRKVRTLAQPAETDTAQPITKVDPILRVIGNATETDSPLAATRVKARTLGLASESDAGQPTTRRKTKVLGQPVESDTALTFGQVTFVPLTQAVETDTVQPLARRKVKTLGLATESASALALTRARRRTLGQATEADAGLAATRVHRRTTGLASETDTAQTYAHRKTKALGIATEADVSLGVSQPGEIVIPLGQATSSNAALPATRVKRKTLGIATESDSATTAGRRKVVTLGLAVETDTTAGLSRTKIRALTRPEETAAALGITAAHAHTLGQLVETAEAQALARLKSKALGLPTETDVVLGVVNTNGRRDVTMRVSRPQQRWAAVRLAEVRTMRVTPDGHSLTVTIEAQEVG